MFNRYLFVLAWILGPAFWASGMPQTLSPSGSENPALLAYEEKGEFQFGTFAIGSHFDEVEGAPSSSQTLWSLGFSYPFSIKKLERKAGLGIFLSGPYGNLRSLRAYEASDLYPLRYGLNDSQFKASVGGALEILPGALYFGSGVHFYLSGAGNSEAVLSTVNPTGRLALDVGLNSAFYSGLFYKEERTSVSLSYKQEIHPEFIQKFDGKASVGGENTFHQPLTARSTLYFEPHTFDLKSQYDSGPLLFGAGVTYELWSNYRHPVLIAETPDTAGNLVVTATPDSSMRNTLSPYASVEVPLKERTSSVALGYRYQPTAVEDLSGIGNPLDSDAHIVGAAYEAEIAEGSFWPAFHLRVFYQHHFFQARLVEKKSTSTIYTFGGNAYALGASLGFPL